MSGRDHEIGPDNPKVDFEAGKKRLEEERIKLTKARDSFPWDMAINDMCLPAQKEDWGDLVDIQVEVGRRMFQMAAVEENIRVAERCLRALENLELIGDIQQLNLNSAVEIKQFKEKDPETMYLEVLAYIDQMKELLKEAEDVVCRLQGGQAVDPLQSLPIILQQIDNLYRSLPVILGQKVEGELLSLRDLCDLNSEREIIKEFPDIKMIIARSCLETAEKLADVFKGHSEFVSQMQAIAQESRVLKKEEVEEIALEEMQQKLNQLIFDFGSRLETILGLDPAQKLIGKYDDWRKLQKEES